MINPWDWLRTWCNRSADRRAELDVVPGTLNARVRLYWKTGTDERRLTGVSLTGYDDAIIQCIDGLPVEVRT